MDDPTGSPLLATAGPPLGSAGRDRINDFLEAMEYPCTRDDLVREGRRAGLADRVVAQLAALQDRRFHGSRDVRAATAADAFQR